MARSITLPNKWTPLPHQLPAFQALDRGVKNILSVWHRRAGKDAAAINYTAKAAHERIGVYWHMMPNLKQARQAIWESIDDSGQNIVEQAFPHELRKRTRNDDMMIELKCGSVWRLLGADNYDSNIGANPVGVTFSEVAVTNNLGIQYVRPILVKNGGWMWLNSTPRGRNFFHELYENNINNPEWHVDKYSILDTGLMSAAQVEAEIASGITSPERAAQEYYCSFEAADEGSIYGRQMDEVERTGRIGFYPYDPRYPVETAWDIGTLDATAIIFVQRINGEIRVIDYHQDKRKFLPDYARVIWSKPYSYSRHIFPHDLDRDHWGAGTSTDEMALAHGINPTIAPKLGVEEGITAVRAIFPRLTFSATTTHTLTQAAKHYHRKWDEKTKQFSKPVHDWSSDPMDALRYLAVTPEGYGATPAWAQRFLLPSTQYGRPQWEPIPPGANSREWQFPRPKDPSAAENYDPLAAYS